MTKDELEILIADKPQQVKAKAIFLYNAFVQNMNAYGAESTHAKLKDWQSAEKALDEFVDSIGGGSAQERTFPGIQSIVDYLRGQGFKISTRTAYNHRDKGHFKPRKDGKYYLSDIETYARSGLLTRLDGTKQELFDDDSQRKRKAEADQAEYDARIKKIRAEAIEGKYILREEFEEEIAVQVVAFRNAIQTYIHSQAEDIVNFLTADILRIPDLVQFMMASVDDFFFKYADEWETRGPLISAVTKSRDKTEVEDQGDSEYEEDYNEP